MSNDIAALKAEAYSNVLQEVLREAFVWKYITNMKFEGMFNGNDTVHFPRMTPIVSQDLANSYAKVTIQNLVTTDETFVLNTRKHFAFEISNEDMIEMKISPQTQAIQDGAQAFANDYDDLIMSEYANAWIEVTDGDMATATNSWGTNSIALTKSNIYDLITAINQKLDQANAPDTDRFVIFSPAEKRLLANAPELLRSTSMWDGVVTGWVIGMIDNTTIYWSNNLVTASNVKHVLAWQGKPICFAANIKPVVEITTSSNRESFSSLVKAQTKFGVKTFTEGANKLVDVNIKA